MGTWIHSAEGRAEWAHGYTVQREEQNEHRDTQCRMLICMHEKLAIFQPEIQCTPVCRGQMSPMLACMFRLTVSEAWKSRYMTW